MFQISVLKIIEKPFKILSKSIKSRSRHWFEKHIQKTCEKLPPTAFKMAPKSFKIEARRAQNHPATPQGLAKLPQTTPDRPQTLPRPLFGPISASILMNSVPKTYAQRPKKQNTATYFHQASDFDGKKIVMRLQFGCGGAAALVSVRFTIGVVRTLSRKEGLQPPLFTSSLRGPNQINKQGEKMRDS